MNLQGAQPTGGFGLLTSLFHGGQPSAQNGPVSYPDPTQFGGFPQQNYSPSDVSQFGVYSRPSSAPDTSQFGVYSRPNATPDASRFGVYSGAAPDPSSFGVY
jgi:hypothetical protein